MREGLDARGVLRFASLGTTEQGESGTQFRVDYLKPSGAIGFYHPDLAVVQKTASGEIRTSALAILQATPKAPDTAFQS